MNDPLRTTLIRHTNHTGLILASEEMLSRELKLGASKVRRRIASLASRHEIEILAPLPFLVARARSWPGKRINDMTPSPPRSSESRSVQRKVPVSGSNAAAATQPEDGGAGEGGALLDHVLAVLGPEADRAEFSRILAGHSEALVHRALARVEATRRIRVSKAALFRSLLEKLSH